MDPAALDEDSGRVVRALRCAAAVAGVAEIHYRRGKSPDPEMKLTLRAILGACADAGIEPREIDGFSSFFGDGEDCTAVAEALRINELHWTNLVWGGGGGGSAAAITAAAIAVATGQADCVAVYRATAQGDTPHGPYDVFFGARHRPHGLFGPVQVCAMRTQRMLEHDGVPRSAMRALSLAAYRHAQNNPTAQAYGQPLDEETYEASRMIAEPFHVYDCSRESDGAVALIVVSAERAASLRRPPAYILAGAQGAPNNFSTKDENGSYYSSSGYEPVARRLWDFAGVGPADVDVVQVYENFTGPAVSSLIDHGLVPAGPDAGAFMTVDNLTVPGGKLPVNTSGGNLANSFINGLNLGAEAVRQIQRTSVNQVPDAHLSLFIGGPLTTMGSSVLFCDEVHRQMID